MWFKGEKIFRQLHTTLIFISNPEFIICWLSIMKIIFNFHWYCSTKFRFALVNENFLKFYLEGNQCFERKWKKYFHSRCKLNWIHVLKFKQDFYSENGKRLGQKGMKTNKNIILYLYVLCYKSKIYLIKSSWKKYYFEIFYSDLKFSGLFCEFYGRLDISWNNFELLIRY